MIMNCSSSTSRTIVNIIQLPLLEPYLYFIPISVLLSGSYQVLNYWQIRNKEYGSVSAASVTSSVLNNGTKISIGFMGILGPLGLILGSLAGQISSVLVLLKQSFSSLFKKGKTDMSNKMRQNAIRYKNFPLVSMPHAFTDAVRELIIISLILYYFGGVTMGIYAFVVRILKLPIGMIGTSMSQVFFQEASEKYANGEDVIPLIKRTLLPLIKIGLPVLVLFMYFADDLITMAFSEKWVAAGIYARILAPWLFFNFLISPITQVPNIVGKQREVFLLSLLGFGSSLCTIVVGHSLFVLPEDTIMLFSIVQSFYLFFVILWIVKIAQRKA
ncbi:MAG: hypothetical protein COB85_06975 [Bacteroidetes bacterium]|nr:MAG: hypothetical protein COB85_06975 [Bacteroidota bacterium]